MRKMKDSGIKWIGEIPKDWELSKIGQVYRLRNTKVSDTEYPPLSVTKKGIVPQLETAAKTNAHDDRKLVKKGDFVINSRSDRRGSCGISAYKGSVSLINTVLYPLGEMNPSYYDWLFHTIQFGDEFYRFGHGIVDDLWTTKWQEMRSITIPMPSLQEQKHIADFLDKKCSEIDSLVADIQSQIETLEQYKKSVITEAVTKGLNPDVEMKDSGIEWIGEIPKHWGLVRLKYCFELKGRIGWQGLRSSEFLDDANLPYLITGTDFNNGLVDWSTCAHITFERFHQDVNIQINENDILITKDGTIGKVAVVKDCPPYVSLNSGVFIVRNNREFKINKKYFYYLILSQQFDYWFDISNKGGSTILHLTQEKFYNFKYTYPSLEEQGEIANYLDQKCIVIDDTILMKQDQLSVLEQYKKSLIYEYVTGKKEVPNQ